MKYAQDRKVSEEILRLLITKMAEHPAAFTPLSYTVWYEHVTGINPALSEEMEKLLGNRAKLDDATIDRLYLKYISEFEQDVEQALREHIFQLLNKIFEFTSETDSQAQQFSDSLHAYSHTLKQKLDPSKLAVLIDRMVVDANKMLLHMQNMQSELAACKLKGEELDQELRSARGEAMTDPLTGVLNRRGFEHGAQKILEEHSDASKSVCLLIVDIDRFKQINDNFGHLFGDKVIRAVAETLKSRVRGQDSVARLGGDEFAVLLADTDMPGACSVAEHIRQTIEECKIFPHGKKKPIGGVTISIGVALYSSDAGLVGLLDQADKALFVSKKQGRNMASVYAIE